jgi:hypothetical protein
MKTQISSLTTAAFILPLLAIVISVKAQQITPVALLSNPEKYQGMITGIGSGDLNKFNLNTSGVSAQGALELLFGTHRTKKRNNQMTFPIVGRYNLLNSSKIFRLDTFDIRNIAFVDNNQTFNAGFRVRNVRPFSDDQFLMGLVGDYSLGSYTILDSINTKAKFVTHSVMLGMHLGVLKNTNWGPIGISASPSINYMYIQNFNPNAFALAAKVAGNVTNQFIGVGGRGLVQLNDISIFGDLRWFFPIGNSATINGLTNSAVLTFGGNAMGMIAKLTKAKTEEMD